VSFEWIGEQNYLRERGNSRGSFRTNVDVIFRFRTIDGRVRIVLTEWKYCESYRAARSLRFSKRGTDRAAIYYPCLTEDRCQIELPGTFDFENLLFDPFDQMMRNQLLASAMERHQEMGANRVSLWHISPKGNEGFLNPVLSKRIAGDGPCSVSAIWGKLSKPGRFLSTPLEDIIPVLVASAPHTAWSKYINLRYGGIGQFVPAHDCA
jgi:hypothetical protein